MRFLQALIAIAALIAAVVYWNFGTLSPCSALRETVRHRDGLAAVLPDSIVDLGIAAQYGAKSPRQCLAILLNDLRAPTSGAAQASRPTQQAPQASPSPTAQEALKWAVTETLRAIDECKAKRPSGELPTYVASTHCSNPRMMQAFAAAHYRYMDLIESFAAKRLDLAAKIDRGEMTEEQAKLEGEKAYSSIQEAERRRDRTATK